MKFYSDDSKWVPTKDSKWANPQWDPNAVLAASESAHRNGDFIHDDSCDVCRMHRQRIDEVRHEMLDDLLKALGQDGIARPWSPQQEWFRLLDRISKLSPAPLPSP